MLVCFEPAASCKVHESGFVLAPLPARKRLWEANNALSWRAQSEGPGEDEISFGLATNGDLVRLASPDPHQDPSSGPDATLNAHTSSRTADWAEWCAGMDDFGGLVMLAASLVG